MLFLVSSSLSFNVHTSAPKVCSRTASPSMVAGDEQLLLQRFGSAARQNRASGEN